MIMQDSAHILQDQVTQAASGGNALVVCGGGSKTFYGRACAGERLETGIHHGITEYTPTELVITARGGTPLQAIEAELHSNGQMLACEPPSFSAQATFGGMLAAGLSGPARPYRSSVQDTVLGCTILNGKGEILRFGGKVMKNVAGYDVSRLMAGALGCLGVILEATVKVLPGVQAELTVAFDIERRRGGIFINDLRRRGLPVTAASHDGLKQLVRFSAGRKEINGLKTELSRQYGFVPWQVHDEDSYWDRLREHKLPFFNTEGDIWRLSVPADADINNLADNEDDILTEWGGCQHWLKSDRDADSIFSTMAQHNGHATLFRAGKHSTRDTVFQPLPSLNGDWHRRLKQAFDPYGVLNPGRMYPDI
jgi:glycolate oxidase FAD binding subunit